MNAVYGFRTFQDDRREGTGLEWVQCVCQRWLYEKCICEIEYDEGRVIVSCVIQVLIYFPKLVFLGL